MNGTKDALLVCTISTAMTLAEREKGYVVTPRTIGLLRGITFTPDQVEKIADEFNRQPSVITVSKREIAEKITAALPAVA